MLSNYKINKTVTFSEHTTVPKEHSDNDLFDILQELVTDNNEYCQILMDKVFALPYAKLPDFFPHHCVYAADPIKWLNKFEKLISENEELFTNSGNQGRMMKCYTIIESKRKEIEQTGYKHTAAKWPMQYVNAECEVRYFHLKKPNKELKNCRITPIKLCF